MLAWLMKPTLIKLSRYKDGCKSAVTWVVWFSLICVTVKVSFNWPSQKNLVRMLWRLLKRCVQNSLLKLKVLFVHVLRVRLTTTWSQVRSKCKLLRQRFCQKLRRRHSILKTISTFQTNCVWSTVTWICVVLRCKRTCASVQRLRLPRTNSWMPTALSTLRRHTWPSQRQKGRVTT